MTAARNRANTGAAVSLATLAAHLGLSPAAISRVLNQVPAAKSIPQSTQERIFAAAREFNYRPNGVARSLRRGHSMTVGVLVPEISEGYATLVLAGLEQGLLDADYAFFLCSHHHRKDVIKRSQIMLDERAVDGIVAIDSLLEYPGSLPLVTISCPIAVPGTTNIVLNHDRAAELALTHLLALGHREIAFIKGQPFSSDTAARWESITKAAKLLGLPLRPTLQVQLAGDAPNHEPGYIATKQLLAVGARFTALFAFNDVSAIGAIRALREKGLEIPRHVSVVGFDDVQSAAFQNPSLTTIKQPLHAMGRAAAEAMVRKITLGNERDVIHREVEPTLVVRESTAPVRFQL